jgi:hypothetical protein
VAGNHARRSSVLGRLYQFLGLFEMFPIVSQFSVVIMFILSGQFRFPCFSLKGNRDQGAIFPNVLKIAALIGFVAFDSFVSMADTICSPL